jgi:ATP-binding cassette, subfamily B, bacterial IrtA/YbtP
VSELPDRPAFSTGLKIIARLCRPAKRAMIGSSILAVAATLLEVVPFIMLFVAVSDLVDGDATAGRFVVLGAIAALSSVVRFVVWGRALHISHVAAFDVIRDLRLQVAEKLATLPLGWFTRRRSGQVQRALTEDVQRLEVLLAHAIPELVSALCFWVVAAIALIVIDPWLALASLVFAPVAFFVLWRGLRDTSDDVRRSTSASDDLHASAAELLRNPDVLHLFDAHGAVSAPTRAGADAHTAAEVRWSRRYATLGTGFRVLVTADFVAVLPVGVWLIATDRTDVTSLLLVLLLGAGIHQPLERAYRLGFRLSWVSYGAAVVDEMLGSTSLPERTPTQRPASNDIEFRNVTFSHEPGTPTLRDISFRVDPGEAVALVGPSGGGKSTLVRLLARFWDVDSGSISIGGVDVREMAVSDLLSRQALVFQDAFLFADSVADNLRVARRDATDDELVAACRAAQIHDVVMGLPDGYDTVLGAPGAGLSGGERQRLTIARAMLRDAPIVVLDEATAMADPDNEAAIQAAISELIVGRTLIVIAHRLRTVTGADRIVVIDDGEIVAEGRHEQLLDDGGRYAEMWDDMIAAEGIGLGAPVAGAVAISGVEPERGEIGGAP